MEIALIAATPENLKKKNTSQLFVNEGLSLD